MIKLELPIPLLTLVTQKPLLEVEKDTIKSAYFYRIDTDKLTPNKINDLTTTLDEIVISLKEDSDVVSYLKLLSADIIVDADRQNSVFFLIDFKKSSLYSFEDYFQQQKFSCRPNGRYPIKFDNILTPKFMDSPIKLFDYVDRSLRGTL